MSSRNDCISQHLLTPLPLFPRKPIKPHRDAPTKPKIPLESCRCGGPKPDRPSPARDCSVGCTQALAADAVRSIDSSAFSPIGPNDTLNSRPIVLA